MLKAHFLVLRCLKASVVLLAAVSAHAATVTVPDGSGRRGAPVAQSFLEVLGDDLSILATDNGVSCVASRKLPIKEAVYLNPDGALVEFSDVTRSPASSIQAIARPGSPVEYRIQLKYSPDLAKPVRLETQARSIDIAPSLETSSDSLWLTGEEARILSDALNSGESIAVRATSEVTGREITDRILAPDLAGLGACLVRLEALQKAPQSQEATFVGPVPGQAIALDGLKGPEVELGASAAASGILPEASVTMALVPPVLREPALPVPVNGLRIEFVARPDPATRIAPSVLQGCRMRDIPEVVYLGRLSTVTGFFSQTQDIYVAFDDAGQLRRAYIPGIFDSALSAGIGRARVSLAADSNLPDQPNRVKGCLGDAPLEASICATSEEGSDRYTIAECGVLGMSETREDLGMFLQGSDMPFLYDFGPSLGLLAMAASDGPRDGIDLGGFRGFDGGWSRGGSRTGGGREGNAARFRDFQGIGAGFPEDDILRIGVPNFDGVVPDVFPREGERDTRPAGGGDGNGRADIAHVPLPGALWLLLVAVGAFCGLAAMGRHRRHSFL